MLTCVIRYDIDPTKRAQFEHYARTWGDCIPRNGADLVGYFSPREGSSTLAYGIYHIESLAADPLGKQNYEFAMAEKFIRSEDRTWLCRADR